MRRLCCLLAVTLCVPALAQDRIYRCETDEGVVYSDQACGASAEIIELREDSEGISIGPPEEVRRALAEKREARAKAWEQQQRAAAQAPPPQPEPIIIEREVGYPFWAWPGNGPQRPPGFRPKPPYRPRPEPPIEPPLRPPGGGDVLRPR